MTPTATLDAPSVAEFSAATLVLSGLPRDGALYRSVSDSVLMELNRVTASHRQLVDTHAALIAGEIARRSAPALGSAGLVQRTGFRTAEEFLRATTGATGRDAVTAVRIGRLLAETSGAGVADPVSGELEEASEPWLAPVATAVTAGGLTVSAAEAIRSGLGSPNSGVTPTALEEAAAQLCAEGTVLDADRLFRRARSLRDELDAAGIANRETERREARSLRLIRRPDGMGRLIWDLDPESMAIATDLYDRTTSPRRGGPRFRDELQARADRILDDPRTTEQLASDVFLQLLQAGAAADSSQLLGDHLPAVRVLVTESALRTRSGHGRIEGHADPVSIETIERLACAQGIQEIVFDEHGHPLDVGREQRLFTRKQRIALAARDGGCEFGECERPPSWCEAHHINHWARDHGNTDVIDGILLCKHHHLLLHNNHWEIIRDEAGRYWLIPPPDVDPDQTPLAIRGKSAALRDLLSLGGLLTERAS